MIRKLVVAIVLLLAINFLAVVGGAGYLISTGAVDGAKATQIAEILFPAPTPTTAPATRPAAEAATPPLLKFDELLAQQTGKSTSEQVQFLRDTFDGRSAQLDRQHRELLDLKHQIDLAQSSLSTDRTAVAARDQAIADREQQAAKQAADAGFQRTLEVYESMSPKQLKELFMKADEALVARYLQSMEPRRVANIAKEFKTPEEASRVNALLERLRTADAPPAAAAADTTPPR